MCKSSFIPSKLLKALVKKSKFSNAIMLKVFTRYIFDKVAFDDFQVLTQLVIESGSIFLTTDLENLLI